MYSRDHQWAIPLLLPNSSRHMVVASLIIEDVEPLFGN